MGSIVFTLFEGKEKLLEDVFQVLHGQSQILSIFYDLFTKIISAKMYGQTYLHKGNTPILDSFNLDPPLFRKIKLKKGSRPQTKISARWFKVTFWFLSWRSVNPLKGLLTIQLFSKKKPTAATNRLRRSSRSMSARKVSGSAFDVFGWKTRCWE